MPATPAPFPFFLPRLTTSCEAARDPVAAIPMAAYMRGQFAFLGIKAPMLRRLVREAMAGSARPTQPELQAAAASLWALPEREYQYAALSLLGKHVGVCDASFLPVVRGLVIRKSWWDTVDTLAANVVGPLVMRHRELSEVMDEWVADDNTWLARTAILHQLRFKGDTDAGRLWRYCLLRAGDREFFIRKAIGWALREYSKTDADAVRAFVAAHGSELSGLSKREALLWLSVQE